MTGREERILFCKKLVFLIHVGSSLQMTGSFKPDYMYVMYMELKIIEFSDFRTLHVS